MPRTRLTPGNLVAAALTAAALAALGAGCGSDRTSAPTAGAPEDRLEAIARRAIDGDISSAESPELLYGRISGPRTVGVDLRLDPSEGDDGALVRLTRGPTTPVYPCPVPERCVVTETPAGTRVVSWDLVEPEEDPGFVSVALHGPRDTRTILLAGPAVTADPRTIDLPYLGSVDAMAAVLTDPEYDEVVVRAPGPRARWTPRTLAAVASSRLPASYAYHEVPGGIGFSAYGPTITLTFLRGDGAGTACPAGYTCATDGALTYGWARGKAVLLRQRDGFAVRVDAARLRRALDGPEDFAADETLRQLVVLTDDPDVAPELSSDWTSLADEVDWSGAG